MLLLLQLVPARARGFELLSRFLSREPNYLLKDPSQLPRLFDVLSEVGFAQFCLCCASAASLLHGISQVPWEAHYPTERSDSPFVICMAVIAHPKPKFHPYKTVLFALFR